MKTREHIRLLIKIIITPFELLHSAIHFVFFSPALIERTFNRQIRSVPISVEAADIHPRWTTAIDETAIRSDMFEDFFNMCDENQKE